MSAGAAVSPRIRPAPRVHPFPIGRAFGRYLRSRGITQADAERWSGVPRSRICEWVNGRRDLSAKQFRRLFESLELYDAMTERVVQFLDEAGTPHGGRAEGPGCAGGAVGERDRAAITIASAPPRPQSCIEGDNGTAGGLVEAKRLRAQGASHCAAQQRRSGGSYS